jgi:predicted RNase H-like HicB family nuclease
VCTNIHTDSRQIIRALEFAGRHIEERRAAGRIETEDAMTAYIALLTKDTDSGFGVEFPDFPGCVTAGATLEDARRMADEALRLHVDGMIEDGDALPAPSPLDVIMQDPANVAAVAFLVDIPVENSRVVRVNITIPEDLLNQIDKATKNRSKFLANAARAALRAA